MITSLRALLLAELKVLVARHFMLVRGVLEGAY